MHWHAFGYDGTRYPADADAKNIQMAVRPLTLSHWFRKPKQMRKGVFTEVDSAYQWLEAELKGVYPNPDLLADTLAFHQQHLELGQDAYSGGYTRDKAGIYVRCLLTCPRTGADPAEIRCPEPPPE